MHRIHTYVFSYKINTKISFPVANCIHVCISGCIEKRGHVVDGKSLCRKEMRYMLLVLQGFSHCNIFPCIIYIRYAKATDFVELPGHPHVCHKAYTTRYNKTIPNNHMCFITPFSSLFVVVFI